MATTSTPNLARAVAVSPYSLHVGFDAARTVAERLDSAGLSLPPRR